MIESMSINIGYDLISGNSLAGGKMILEKMRMGSLNRIKTLKMSVLQSLAGRSKASVALKRFSLFAGITHGTSSDATLYI